MQNMHNLGSKGLPQELDRRTVLDQNTVGFTLLGFLPKGLPLRVSTTVWMYIRVYPPHRLK
jgi:hypothetical protein